MADSGELKTYKAAVSNGFYHRNAGGLMGKYDNVRQTQRANRRKIPVDRYSDEQLHSFGDREGFYPDPV